MQLTKEQRFGLISSTIFLVIFTGLMMIFGFSAPYPPPEEEGILINFGSNESGLGFVEPRPAAQPIQEEVIPEPSSTPPPVSNDEQTEEVLTQDFDKTAAIEEQKKKERIKQEEIERKNIEEEKERLRQEKIKKERIAEEQRKKEEQRKVIEDRAKNAFGGKNPSGDNTGEGETYGKGNQGDPNGSVNSDNRQGNPDGANGISFDLTGRSPSSLPKPAYNTQAEGKVVVEVTVDQNGNVVSARAGVKGSTTSNKQLYEAAQKAAQKAKFDVSKNAPALQKGTITYHFMLQ